MKVKNSKKNERLRVSWRPRTRCPRCGFPGPHYVVGLDLWICVDNPE